MAEEKDVVTIMKYMFVILVIVFSIYVISNLIKSVEIIVGVIAISMGLLSIIWTILAKFSLSPGSKLRVFANNFLACSIAVVGFSIVRVVGQLVVVPWLILAEFFFIFATFFFFLLASFYIYSIGKEFGFEDESRKIGKLLKKKHFKPKRKKR